MQNAMLVQVACSGYVTEILTCELEFDYCSGTNTYSEFNSG